MAKAQKQATFRDRDHDNLLVLLEKAQNEFGYVTEEYIAEVAKSLNISQSEVYGVVTFYSFLSTRPLGKYVIRVCQSLPCYLENSLMIIQSVGKELGIKPGEATADRKFSLELTNCIGACDKAPAMLVNRDVHGNLTPEKIAPILRSYQ